ncbi:MAG: curli production assembly protein CsgG [Acidobacteria bacterium]|nr:curli production assembly protein CsgG [Acidobacteriota bacterium]
MKRQLILLLFILAVTQAGWGQKKRVAVLDFEYGTVQSGISAIFGQNIDIGKGIADLLVDRLVRDGTYTVIERKAIQKVLAEQNFSNSDRADSNSAAKIGKLLGVDAIIIGSITQFGRDDKSVGVGGGVFRGTASKYGLGNVGMKNAKAVVGISSRTVSVDTGEILSVASGKGESQRSGTTLFGSGSGSATAAGGGIDMSSSNFANSIIGEATAAAVDKLRADLVAGAAKVPERVVHVEGLIADVSGNTLILNVGAKSGLKVGQTLQVVQGGREIRDPATGKVLRRIGASIGTVTITEVDEGSSTGNYAGAAKPKVGDQVKSQGK